MLGRSPPTRSPPDPTSLALLLGFLDDLLLCSLKEQNAACEAAYVMGTTDLQERMYLRIFLPCRSMDKYIRHYSCPLTLFYS